MVEYLQGMIKQRNQNIQKKYSIGKPVFLDVPKHQDFGKMKDKFLGKLNKLQINMDYQIMIHWLYIINHGGKNIYR